MLPSIDLTHHRSAYDASICSRSRVWSATLAPPLKKQSGGRMSPFEDMKHYGPYFISPRSKYFFLKSSIFPRQMSVQECRHFCIHKNELPLSFVHNFLMYHRWSGSLFCTSTLAVIRICAMNLNYECARVASRKMAGENRYGTLSLVLFLRASCSFLRSTGFQELGRNEGHFFRSGVRISKWPRLPLTPFQAASFGSHVFSVRFRWTRTATNYSLLAAVWRKHSHYVLSLSGDHFHASCVSQTQTL